MFLENLGRLFFSKIRPFFFFILVSLPLLLTGIYTLGKRLEMSNLEDLFESTLVKASKSLNKRSSKEHFFARYSNPLPYFLDQNIESLVLLQNEIDLLSTYRKHPAISEKELIEARISYLTSKNRISFMEESIRSTNLCKESEEKMKKSVEMDEKDLKKILSLIENVPIGPFEPHPKSPQLIITDLILKKKKVPFDQEIFEVKIDLLKREFNPL